MAVTWTQTVVNLAGVAPNAATYTSPSLSFGTPSSDRIVVVEIAYQVVTSMTVTTIGGVTAILAVRDESAGVFGSAVWFANVPSGSTGTIAFSDSGNFISALNIAVGTITGAGTSPTPTTATFPHGVSAAPSVTLNVPSGAIGVMSLYGDRAITGSWTNAQSDSYDQTQVASEVVLEAGDTNGNVGGSLAVTWNGTLANYSMSAAIFSAAGVTGINIWPYKT